MPYGIDGEPVSPRDVLGPDELASYYRQRDNRPTRTFTTRPYPVLRDEFGYVSTDGGNLWRWEPGGAA